MSKGEMVGIYHATGRGYGFFTPDGGGEDWFVPPQRENGAWDGDTVKLRPDWGESDGNRQVGAVTAILERANSDVVGRVEKQGREFWLLPDNKSLPPVLLMAKRGRVGAGDKAAAHMTAYGARNQPPMGRLTENFGRANTRQAAVEATLYQYDMEPTFPPDVLLEAERSPKQVEQTALTGRLDLRSELIITIDGAAAKDLDDAVSLTRDGQGRAVLGVHIADVSHYVTQRSALDREAWERGTSVYFADRVIPMLPPELSNGICSLNPQVDRLTLSCIMTLDDGGRVVEHEIVKSVIRTAQRMTYEDCNILLEGSDPALEGEYAPILPMLRDMAALAAKLEKTRRLRGSLELESSEVYIRCDHTGRPVGVDLRQSGVSEGLIEEFMLLANETVAKHLHGLGKPAVYRVHEKPSEDKMSRLRAMLAPLGLDVGQGDHFALQKVLAAVKGKSEEGMVNTLLLRSMMKARYDGENLGHFGLAAQYYCHFTSPIRRYPDLMVHRILTVLLEGRLNREREGKLKNAAQRAAVQSSQRELAAQSAEREIEKFYMAEFMQSHVGEKFTGTVSGVTRTGVFVTLPFGVEGRVDMDGDMDFDESRMTLRGRGGVVYSFGMPLEVVCVSADGGTGQVLFALEGTSSRPKGTQQAPKLPKKKGGKRPPAPRKRKR